MVGYKREVNMNRKMEKVRADIEDDIYIQGVTGGTDQTSGGCSLC